MTEVDERIVELRFENKQFERETAQTMSTLDKLKEKLKFKNASSGVDELQRAVAKININPIVQGIGTIETKMSAMAIAGKRVVENVVDWAMSGLGKIESKLSGVINQVVTGGKNRAQNIEQAKFQLKGLGVAWEDIQEDINYGVQDTAYGLDAAAKVASQLVASNIQLGDDMKRALLGISGVAAMTNSTYEDIGSVYTKVAGNGRLMGEQLLQLSSRGINAAATLAKALNTTEAEVRDMVSKGEISFQMFSDAMWEAFGEHAKSANETFSGALSNTKAALSRLGADVAAQGFNSIRDILNTLIPKLKKFKSEMKPVEDAINSMIDAVGKLVQTLVNALDIEGIVEKISPILERAATVIGDFAAAYELVFSQRRLTRLGGKNTTAFIEEQKGLEALKQKTKEASDEIEELFNISPEQIEKANAIWKEGKYGNGADRVKALGKDYNIVQAYVEKMIELGWDEAKMNEFLAKQEKDHKEAVEDEARAYKKKKTVEKLYQIYDNLKTVLTNVATSIKNVLSVAFESVNDAFKGKSLLDNIVTLTKKLADLSEKFKINEKRAQKLRPVFDAIVTVVKTLGKIVVNTAKVLGKLISGIASLINKAKESTVLQKIFDGIRTAIGKIIDAVVTLYNKLKDSGVWDKFVDVLRVVGEFLGTILVDAFNGLASIITSIGEGAVDIFGKLVGKMGELKDNAKEGHPWLDKIKDFFKENILEGSWLQKLKDLLHEIFGDGKNVYKKAFDMASSLVNGLVDGFKNLSLENVETISKIFAIFATGLGSLRALWGIGNVTKSAGKLTGQFGDLLDSLTQLANKYGKRVDIDRFSAFARAIATIVGSFIALVAAYAVLEYLRFDPDKIYAVCKEIMYVFLIVAGTVAVLIASFSKEKNIVSTNAGKYLNILPQAKIPAFAASLLAIGYLLQAIIRSIMTVYNMITADNFDAEAWQEAETTITLIMIGLMVFTGIALRLSKAISGFGGFAATIISLGIMLAVVLSSVKKMAKLIGKYGIETVLEATGLVAGLVLELMIFAGIIIGMTRKNDTEIIGKQINPFKGMFGMFVGLAALITFGMIPLLKALTEANKTDEGLDAIGDFEAIVTRLLAWLTIFVVLVMLLSKTYKSTNANLQSGVGREFVMGQGGTGPMWAIVGIIAALALMFAALAKTMKSLQKVDSKVIRNFKEMMELVIICATILSVLAGALSLFAGPEVIAALLGVAAVFLGIGVAFLGAGIGFKAFAEGAKTMVEVLPDIIDSIADFLTDIAKRKDDLIYGVMNARIVLAEVFASLLVGGSLGLITAIPEVVHNLTVALVAAVDQLASDIYNEGPKLVDAMDRLSAAFLYLLLYAKENAFKSFRSTFWTGFKDLLKGLFGTAAVEDLYKEFAPSKPIEEQTLGDKWNMNTTEDWKKAWGNEIDSAVTSHTAEIEQAKAKLRNEKHDEANGLFEFQTYTDLNELTQGNSKFVKMISKYTGLSLDNVDVNGIINNYAGGFTDMLGNTITPEKLLGAFDSKDFSEINTAFGVNWGEDQWAGYLSAFDEGGAEAAQEYLDIYGVLDTINLGYADNMETYGETGFYNYSQGVENKKETVVTASREVMDAALEEMRKYNSEWYEVGEQMPAGVAQGAKDSVQRKRAVNNIADIVTLMKEGTEKKAEINSPSRVFARLGAFMTMGLAEGIMNVAGLAEDSSESVGEMAINSLRTVLDRIYGTTIDGMDTNPVISPILDLTQLEQGLNDMDGLVNTRNSFGLAFGAGRDFNANLAARNLALTDEGYYDGTNVVDAINGLRSDMNSMKDAMANMGFYVDGREMAHAIAKPMNNELNDIYIREGRGVR